MAEKLRFAEKNKSPSRLIHDLPGHMLSTQLHRKARESDDNAGTDALDNSVYLTETAVRAASKAQQKKRIKQEYAQAKRTSQESARASEIAGKAVVLLQEKARQAAAYVANQKGIFIITGCILVVLLIFTSLISSCSVIVQSGLNAIGTTTYPSETEDILAVEEIYQTKEENLQNDLDTYEIRYLPADYQLPDTPANPHTPVGAKFQSGLEIPFVTEEHPWDNGPLDHTWVYLYEAVREGKDYPIKSEEALRVMQAICEIKKQNHLM